MVGDVEVRCRRVSLRTGEAVQRTTRELLDHLQRAQTLRDISVNELSAIPQITTLLQA